MVAGRGLIGLCLGLVAGVALLQLLRGGRTEPATTRRRPSARAVLWLVGLGSGVAMFAVTGWVVFGIAGGFLVAQMVAGAREMREQRRILERRAELARFASSMRNACLAGYGMPDAIRIAAGNAGPAIRAEVVALSGAVQRVGVGKAFQTFGESATDPLVRVFATMVGEADRAGGGALSELLSQLARQTMREISGTREASAGQGGQRATAPIVAGVGLMLLLLMRFASPSYARAYSDAAGQLGMAAGLVPIGIGYLVLVRINRSVGRAMSWGGGR